MEYFGTKIYTNAYGKWFKYLLKADHNKFKRLESLSNTWSFRVHISVVRDARLSALRYEVLWGTHTAPWCGWCITTSMRCAPHAILRSTSRVNSDLLVITGRCRHSHTKVSVTPHFSLFTVSLSFYSPTDSSTEVLHSTFLFSNFFIFFCFYFFL